MQWDVCDPEGGPHPTMLALWPWTYSLLTCENCLLFTLTKVYGILFYWPKKTKMGRFGQKWMPHLNWASCVLSHRNLDRAIQDSSTVSARNQNSLEGWSNAQFDAQKRSKIKRTPGPGEIPRFLLDSQFEVLALLSSACYITLHSLLDFFKSVSNICFKEEILNMILVFTLTFQLLWVKS